MDKPEMPLVACVVLNWNGMSILNDGKPILETCLRTLAKTKYDNFKIIVVDASSHDSSANYIKTKFKGMDLLNVENIGWTHGNNMGAKQAYKMYPNTKYFVFLNNDLEFTDELWLKKLVDAAEKDPKIGVVGAKLLHSDGKIDNCGAHISMSGLISLDSNPNLSKYTKLISGAAIMIKKDTISGIGLFDETYLPFYGDETDYCERVRKAGYLIYYVSEASIVHGSQKSTHQINNIKPTFTREQIIYALIRNTYIFVLRHYPNRIVNSVIFSFVRSFITATPIIRIRKPNEIRYMLPMVFTALGDALSNYKTYKIGKLSD